jgi:hypothetical protein
VHPEMTERLFQVFPDLFNKEQLTHGFECQDGWFELLYKLAVQIREYRSQCSGQTKNGWTVFYHGRCRRIYKKSDPKG